MVDRQVVKALLSLYRIIEAGEKGYALAAANIPNRGLKVIFKAFAQQRARFKTELGAELKHLGGGEARPRSSVRAMLHRGRIDIFATLIVEREGRERMILKEILVGEKVALTTYENILKKGLPLVTRELIKRQYTEVRGVVDQIQQLRGRHGKRQVLSLYESEKDVERAIQLLRGAGFGTEAIEHVKMSEVAELYQGRGSAVSEAVLSGAAGGALWGSLLGSLAGLGVLQTSSPDPLGLFTAQFTWAIVALAGIGGGAFVGAVLGFFIGLGVAEEDVYEYSQGILHGQALVKILVDETRAREVEYLLMQVNFEALLRPEEAPA
jgi:uncharacterized protein (TIGR02284 family)